MQVKAILSIGVLSLVIAPQASATRVACYGTNEERLLDDISASADEHVMMSLPELIESTAHETSLAFATFGVFENSTAVERKEYWLTDENENFVIIIEETNSKAVSISVERACQSSEAGAWQMAWDDVLSRLEAKGLKYD